MEILADVVFGIEGDGVVVVLGGAVGPGDLEIFGDDGWVDGGEVAAGAAAHGIGAEKCAAGGHVNIAGGIGEGGDGVERITVDEKALRVYARALGVLGHEADGGLAERAVGDGAVDAAELAADVVDPRFVFLLHGGEAHGDFVAETAVEIELGAEQIVAADHELDAGEIAGEEPALGDLVVGAAQVGFAVEKGVGAAEDFHALGGVGLHRRIPDPAVAHGVVVHDAAEDALVGEGGVGVGLAGDEPFGHLVEVGGADVFDELRVDDRDGIGDVLQVLHGAHPGGRLHGFVAEVLLLRDGENRELHRFGVSGRRRFGGVGAGLGRQRALGAGRGQGEES